MNVQVACTITGCLAWISDPISGSRHDNHCLGESVALLSFDPRNWLGETISAVVALHFYATV
jgi:hypothetical protein